MSHAKYSGQTLEDILPLMCCPKSGSALTWTFDLSEPSCNAISSDGSKISFPVVQDQPALVDFKNSILEQEQLLALDGSSLIDGRARHQSFLKKVLLGENPVSRQNAKAFLDLLRTANPIDEVVVLIVGGGTVGEGTQELYHAEGVRIIAFDVYASDQTDFIADAHSIPLRDGTVNGVWIQAVLEHVLTPHEVVKEIWRVLGAGGIVYAETPFLQPVHEGPYDFTRYTESGHRWLFRNFALIKSGVAKGPGSVLFQTLRYTAGAILRNRRLGSFVMSPFFWLRFADYLADPTHASDAASGCFFLGRKSNQSINPQEMPAEFRGVKL